MLHVNGEDLRNWAPVASATAAAFAAGLSYLSVREARNASRLARRPYLLMQAVNVGGEPGTTVVVRNAGGGMACGVIFWFQARDEFVHGSIGVGFLDPGDEAVIETSLPSVEDATPPWRGVVAGRDVDGNSYVWASGQRERQLKTWLRRRPRFVATGTAFQTMWKEPLAPREGDIFRIKHERSRLLMEEPPPA